MRLHVFLAWRSLLASKLTLVLLAIAIAAGAGFQIPNSANLSGFNVALLDDGLVRGAGDVRIEPREGPRFDDGDAIAERVRAAAPQARVVPVLVYAGAIGVRGRFVGTPVVGIPAGERPYHISAGAPLAADDDEGVVVGYSFAKRLGVKVGDEVELRVVFGRPGDIAEDVGAFTQRVRGIVSGSGGAYRFVFVDRAFLAREAGVPKAASAVIAHLADHFTATHVAARIEAAVPEVHAVGWPEDDPYLTNYLAAMRTIGRVSYSMVIAAVAIPMWALLYILVLRRSREIALLSALGFRRREIFAIYLLQSLVVALIGCALGSALGFAVIQYFDANPVFQWESLVVRPLVTTATFAIPALVIIVTAVLAGCYPAWRASRVDPAKVLRRIE